MTVTYMKMLLFLCKSIHRILFFPTKMIISKQNCAGSLSFWRRKYFSNHPPLIIKEIFHIGFLRRKPGYYSAKENEFRGKIYLGCLFRIFIFSKKKKCNFISHELSEFRSLFLNKRLAQRVSFYTYLPFSATKTIFKVKEIFWIFMSPKWLHTR